MKTVGKIVLGLVALLVVLAVVGWFALRTPDIPYAELERKYANAESEYMGVPGGIRAHYRDQGNPDGPVLVMVHGFSASLHTWEPWVERLGNDYRIVTLDLPGHGLTRAPEGYQPSIQGYADFVNTVTERLGLHDFTLIGSSMGGATSWVYALEHQEKLNGLVLVGAAGWPETREESDQGPAVFKLLANPVGRAVLGRLDSTEMVRGGLRSAFEPTPDMADDAMVERYVDLARAPGHRDIIFGLMTSYQERPVATEEKLAALSVPTLVMHGDTDNLVPANHGEKFNQAIPGSTLIMYEKTGHVPMEQIADKSAADLRAWLEANVQGGQEEAAAAK